MIVNILFENQWNFFYFLNLSATASILSSLGLSMFVTDGLKSGILVLREKVIKNKIFLFLSPYLDRLVGLFAAIFIFVIFYFKNYLISLFSIIILFLLTILNWRNEIFRGIFTGFILSMFSHVMDAFSLYIFIHFVFKYDIFWSQWLLAFIFGGVSSLLSVFGGLGGRALGINLFIKDLNTSFTLDIIYYLMQLFSAIIAILLFNFYKIINFHQRKK